MIPESIDTKFILLVLFFSSRWGSSPTAVSTVLTSSQQITTRTQIPATTICSTTEKASRTKSAGACSVAWVSRSSRAETTQVIGTDPVRVMVGRRHLAIASRETPSIPAAHGHTSTGSSGLACETLHFGLLLLPLCFFTNLMDGLWALVVFFRSPSLFTEVDDILIAELVEGYLAVSPT